MDKQEENLELKDIIDDLEQSISFTRLWFDEPLTDKFKQALQYQQECVNKIKKLL